MFKIKVRMLTANGCNMCARAKRILTAGYGTGRFSVEIEELSLDAADSKPAVDLAIENNYDLVPSFKVGDRVFVTDLFTEEDIRRALWAEYVRLSGDTRIGG